MKYDVIVMGGGSAGYVAGSILARNGLKVLVAEKKKFGGTCVNAGCVSSIFLYDSSFLYSRLNELGNYKGLNISAEITNSIFKKRNDIVNYLSDTGKKLVEDSGAETVISEAEIYSQNEVKLLDLDKKVEFKFLVIATGSSPYSDIKGAEYAIDEDKAVNLDYIPSDMIVIGGGYAGVEIAQIYARLGSEVTLLTRGRIMKSITEDARKVLYDALDFDGVQVYEHKNVKEITRDGRVITEDGSYEASTIVVATGRRPNIPRGLCKLNVEYNEKGIIVNTKMEASNSKVYAAGDVIYKGKKTAHAAITEGLIAALNILGKNVEMNYKQIPQVIYTDPQVATIGSLNKAKKFYTFPYSANTRAIIHGLREGYVKIGVDESEKIRYAEVVGYDAEELINTLTLAVKLGLKPIDLALTPFIHPSLSEGIINAAKGFYSWDVDMFKG